MEVTHTETNRGQPAIVVNGILYRISNTLQADDVVYRCTTKSCKMSITTDKDETTVLKKKVNTLVNPVKKTEKLSLMFCAYIQEQIWRYHYM